MRERTISAILGFLIFIPLLFKGGVVFAYTMFALGAMGLFELARMRDINYFNMIGLIATFGLGNVLIPGDYLYSFSDYFNPFMMFFLSAMALLISTVYRHQTFNIEDAALIVFGALYIGMGFNSVITMRDMGLDTILFLFLVIWSTDTGAYISGRLFGKHSLAPQISPNKTIEGAIGGVLSAILIGGLFMKYFQPNLGQTNHAYLLIMTLSMVGQFGDLVESAYKRHFGVKDSGNLLPGHGGVLDRFDSTIFASIMFMVWINLIR